MVKRDSQAKDCCKVEVFRPTMERKRALLLVFLAFSALYYFVRVAIFYAGITGGMEFEEEQTELVEDIVSYSFLAIGVLGLIMLPGLVLSKAWAFWGTLALSVYTIVWDAWAAIWVQSSAAAGIVPAAIIIGYLLISRHDYLRSAKRISSKEGSA